MGQTLLMIKRNLHQGINRFAQVTPCWANVSTCDFTWRKDLVTGQGFHSIQRRDLIYFFFIKKTIFAGGVGSRLWQTTPVTIINY